ncbi:hypothetical protein QYM36_004156 [Artemia franciscana]|uniref:PDZ domain-containing protein n=1 Tax=Artemia franciscana TaxID=6661 RepID=A0AA88I5B5_ARTSF|nr:hypothetical protein QYM36_004156 [Artemia franciscana]
MWDRLVYSRLKKKYVFKTVLTVKSLKMSYHRPSFWRVPRNRDEYAESVFIGSPADGELKSGDQVLRINNTDATKLTHQEAHDILKDAGTKVTLAVNRAANGIIPPKATPRTKTSTTKTVSSDGMTTYMTTTHTSSSQSNTRKVTTVTGQTFPKKFAQVVQSPLDNLPMSVFEAADNLLEVEEDMEKERERALVTSQPYRTLPLVMPSPKPKRDVPLPAQSYLRFQPSLTFQGTPSSSPLPPHPVVNSVNQSLMQQKLEPVSAVIDHPSALKTGDTPPQPQVQASNLVQHVGPALMVVHKQFNSPMNLYSAENVAKTIEQQTGVLKTLGKPTAAVNPETRSPLQKEGEAVSALGPQSKQYDPHQSPTYQALIEENEKVQTTEMRPPVTKVYTAPRAPKINSLGTSNEKIYQSYSFNKIMADVLGESAF